MQTINLLGNNESDVSNSNNIKEIKFDLPNAEDEKTAEINDEINKKVIRSIQKTKSQTTGSSRVGNPNAVNIDKFFCFVLNKYFVKKAWREHTIRELYNQKINSEGNFNLLFYGKDYNKLALRSYTGNFTNFFNYEIWVDVFLKIKDAIILKYRDVIGFLNSGVKLETFMEENGFFNMLNETPKKEEDVEKKPKKVLENEKKNFNKGISQLKEEYLQKQREQNAPSLLAKSQKSKINENTQVNKKKNNIINMDNVDEISEVLSVKLRNFMNSEGISKDIDHLTSEKKSLIMSIEQLTKQAAILMKENNDLINRRKELEKNNDDKNNEINELKKEFNELNNELNQLNKQNREIGNKIVSRRELDKKEDANHKDKLKKYQEWQNMSKKEIDEYNKEYLQGEEELKNLKDEISKSKDEINKSKLIIKKYTDEIANMQNIKKQKYNEMIADLKNKKNDNIDRLNKEVATQIQQFTNEYNKNIKDSSETLVKILKEIEEKKEELNILRTKCHEYMNAINKYQKMLNIKENTENTDVSNQSENSNIYGVPTKVDKTGFFLLKK